MKIKSSPSSISLRFIFSLLFILIFSFSIKINAQIIATIAGNGAAGYTGDGGASTAAEINLPAGIAIDASGNIYISDTPNNRIRKVNTSGVISTIAGNGVGAFTGDGGQATAAEINAPKGMTIDASGNLFFADCNNNRIREINTSGVISTFAGNGFAGFSGNGGAATAAELHSPTEITFDGSGNGYISDGGNDRVRKVIVTTGNIAPFAGNGFSGFAGDGGQATAAEMNGPADIFVDGSGNAYITDKNNNRIRKVTSGTISTIAGNGTASYSGDGAAATLAEINSITGVRVSPTGVIYIGDFGNNRIREISSGTINTLAGISTSGYTGDGGQANAAELDNPGMMAFDQLGNLYFTDHANNCIRVVYLALTVSTSISTNVSCNGGNSGSASATPIHGTTPYTYSWSGGGTNVTKTGLTAGTYTINVTDNDGITGSATVTITQPTALTVSASTTSNVSCSGGSNGNVSSTPSGGTSPYTYTWTGGSTNSTETGLTAGTYTITVTDNNGCTATASTTITQPPALTVSASVTANVSCNSGSNGSVSATPSGGTSPYTYSWSGGGTNATKTSLTAGTYSITVTDNKGCTATASATITQPSALSVSASVTANVSCNGGSNGSVLATPSGGTTPYTYSWSGGGTNSTKTALAAGTYTITVTDKNACSATASATITQPTSLSVSASVTANASYNGESDGAVSATPSGGTSPYTYSWTGDGTNSTETGLMAGTYTITLMDNKGCTATASATITQPLGVLATVTSNVSGSGLSDGAIVATASGGTSPYTYSWSGGGTDFTLSGLSIGTYTITVTDILGFNVSAIATVNQPTTYVTQLQTNILSSEETVGPNTSLAVGKTPYNYGVSQSGAANYSVPIVIPPGTMGMVPSLSIAYNSQSSGGSLGYGWSLSGLSCISRLGQTPYHNFSGTYPDQTQGVTLTNSDWFALDGNRLITTDGDNGLDGTTYATESETYDLITSNGRRGVGPDWFQVQTKNGLVMEYGHTNDSRLMPVGKITAYAWYIDKIKDKFGNYLTFHYMNNNGEIRVQEIDYTGNTGAGFTPYNSVIFTYTTKSDPNTTYVAGGALNSNYLISNIIIYSHSTFFKKYSFQYASNLYTLLQEIDETGSDNTTLNPLKFSYGSDMPVLGSDCSGGPKLKTNYCVVANPYELGGISDGASSFDEAAQFTLLDYNGDGKEDVITLNGGYAQEFTSSDAYLPLNEYGIGWNTQVLYTGENTCPYFTSNSYDFPIGKPTAQGNSIYHDPVSNTPVGGLNQSAGDFNGDGKDDYAVSTFTNLTPGSTNEFADQEEDINIALSTGTTLSSTPIVLKGYDMYSNSDELTGIGAPAGTTLSGTFYLDLNGDGQMDVFNYHFDPTFNKDYYRVWLDVGSSSTTPQEQLSSTCTVVPAIPTSPNFEITVREAAGSYLDFSKAIPMDLNGDGKTELVNVYQWNNGSTNTNPQRVIVSFDATQVYGQPNYVAEVDGGTVAPWNPIPGNGIVIQQDNSGFSYNTNTYVVSDSNFESYNYTYNPISGDYNTYFPTGTYGYENVYGNTTSLNNGTSPYVLYGDFNGDGITDVLTYTNSTSAWTMNLGEGGGNYASLAVSTLSSDNPFSYPSYYYYAHDVNGDGKTDILEFIPDEVSGNTVINTYYSIGTSFVAGTPITLYGHDINPNTWQIAFGDFNGDGVDDLLLENNIGDGAIDGHPLLLYFYSGTQSRRLAESVDGYNETVQFTYQPLTNSNIYTQPQASDYRSSTNSSTLLDIQPPMYVVSRLTSVDGSGNHTTTSINKDGNSNYVTYTDTNSTTYSYQDLICNRLGLGLLGFLNVTSYNTLTDYSTSSTYTVSPTFENMVPSTSTVTAVTAATTISDAANTYTAVALGGLRYNMQETESVTNDDIAGVTNTSNYTYDSYGNVTDKNNQISITSTSAVVETSDVQNTYVQSGTWIPSSASTYTSTVTYLSNPSYTRVVSNSWDAYGHLLSTTTDPSTTGSVTTASTYDTHTGAVLSYTTTTTDPDCIATAETNSCTYDTWSQFKTSSTNPLGQITYYTYNSMWGKPYIVTTPDGLATDYYYDAFGRSSEIDPPDGLTQTLTYSWVGSGDLPIVSADPFDITPTSLYSVYSDKLGSPPLQTYYDWFDRKTFIETTTLSANVFKEQAYDAMGHDYQSTNTYQKASISSDYGDYDPVITTKLYSDILYRLTNVTSTCTSAPTLTTSFSYTNASGNTTVTTTKADGTTSSQTTDPAGLMVNSTDYLLSSPTTVYSTVDYTYLSNGHAASVILNGETVQTFTYDDYGRQTSLSDVNFVGNYSYVYNAYSQLYTQEDPNGDTYTMTYDLLGRPATKVSSAEGTYTYNYVTSGNGLNQLLNQQLVNTATSYTSTISYTYDALHRPLTMDVNGLTTTYYYDPTYGYLVNKTYPGSGFEITNIYDASNYGFLIETDNTANSAAIWTANVMNPTGQYVDYTLGDGVHTKKSYSPYGLLQSISGGSYQSSTYDFDPTNGNLSDRTENNLSETFTYDASLNSRLATATTYTSSVQTAKITTDYDQNGNIESKSDICATSTTYTDVTANNQISEVPNSSSLINPGQSVTYTSFNAPLTISLNSYSLAFTYGPDNNREQTVMTDPSSNTITRTYGNAYEKTVYSDGTPTTEVNYIQCGGDLVAMDVKQGSVDTMNYVYSDHLGSILAVVNTKATYNQSFDVWGNYRNPANGTNTSLPTNPLWMYRGFTGHEHLPQFQLINANGRLYDPLVGSMLSPDITVQSPTNTQNFNRYSYCMNNPLKYSDPSGFQWIITAQMAQNEYSAHAAEGDISNYEGEWMGSLNNADDGNMMGIGANSGGPDDPGDGADISGDLASIAAFSGGAGSGSAPTGNTSPKVDASTTASVIAGTDAGSATADQICDNLNAGFNSWVASNDCQGECSTSDTYTVNPTGTIDANGNLAITNSTTANNLNFAGQIVDGSTWAPSAAAYVTGAQIGIDGTLNSISLGLKGISGIGIGLQVVGSGIDAYNNPYLGNDIQLGCNIGLLAAAILLPPPLDLIPIGISIMEGTGMFNPMFNNLNQYQGIDFRGMWNNYNNNYNYNYNWNNH